MKYFILAIAGSLSVTVLFAQPVISSLNVYRAATDATIQINGSGFNSDPNKNILYFGPVRAAVLSASPTVLTVRVPVGAAYARVSVLNTQNGLSAWSPRPFVPTDFGGPDWLSPSTSSRTRPWVWPLPQHFEPYVPFVLVPNLGFSSTDCVIGPTALLLNDLDGDGRADVVLKEPASCGKGSAYHILRNTSQAGSIDDGSFAEKVTVYPPYTETDTAEKFASLSVADMDGDGKADLVGVTGQLLGIHPNISVVGTIAFGPVQSFGVESPSRALSVGDLDGDGRPDVAVCVDNGVRILRNTTVAGTGTFSMTSGSTIPLGFTPLDIELEDLDGDGRLDLAVLDRTGAKVWAVRNTSSAGALSFVVASGHATGPLPRSLACADLNGDGLPELVVANTNFTGGKFGYRGKSLSVLQNLSSSGLLSFGSKVDYETGSTPSDVTAADLNGDGHLDLITANRASHNVSVLQNAGLGGAIRLESFETKLDFNTETSPIAVSVGDVDGDGRPDILAGGYYGALTLSMLRFGLPAGPPPVVTGFSPASGGPGTVVSITGSNLQGATAVRFGGSAARSFTVTGPGTISAVVGDGASGAVSVETAYGEGRKAGYTHIRLGHVVQGFAPLKGAVGTTITITGQGFNPDAAKNVVYFGSTWSVATAATGTSLTVAVPVGARLGPPCVLDKATGLMSCASGDFTPIFAGGTGVNANNLLAGVDVALHNFTDLALGDLDGDGKTDIAAVSSLNNGSLHLLRNTSTTGSLSTGSFTASPEVLKSADAPAFEVLLADLNGDGRLDVVTANGSVSTVSVFENRSVVGRIEFGQRMEMASGGLPGGRLSFNMEIRDIDVDGRPDILVVNNSGGTLSILRNTTAAPGATPSFAPQYEEFAGREFGASFVDALDIEGDGRPDFVLGTRRGFILIGNRSSRGRIGFRTLRSDAHFEANVTAVQDVAAEWGQALGDLDADGRADLAIVHKDKLKVYRNVHTGGLPLSGSFASPVVMDGGLSPRGIQMGDLDGDGRLDLLWAWANSSRQYLSAMQGLGSIAPGGFGPRVDYDLGLSPSAVRGVRIGDLDGDGVPDIALATTQAIRIYRCTTLAAAPVLDSIRPLIAGIGDTVRLYGRHLSGPLELTFGGVAAAWVAATSPTEARAVLGSGATGSVRYRTSGGTAELAGFTYSGRSEVPRIDSIIPAQGPVGTLVRVHGRGFDARPEQNALWFGGRRAVVSRADDSTLWASVPVGSTPRSVRATNLSTARTATWGAAYPVLHGPQSLTAQSFSAAVSLSTSHAEPRALAHDLDGDGNLDLVLGYVGGNPDRISVFRGTGNGAALSASSFDTRVDLGVGQLYIPIRTAAGDLDGDGRPDLLISNWHGNKLTVMRNVSVPGTLSTASFEAPFDLPLDQARNVTVEDVDGDGRADLVAINSLSGNIRVYRNASIPGSALSAASFSTYTEYPCGGGPFSLAVRDLDGDGRPDIIVGQTIVGKVSVLRNTSERGALGPTSFSAPVEFTVAGNTVFEIAAGDLNGDGRPEIVAGSDANQVFIFRNNASPGVITTASFATRVDYAVFNPAAIELADLNGDGRTDILAASAYGAVSFLRNTAAPGSSIFDAGSFAASVDLIPSGNSSGAKSVGVADLDGDLLPDIYGCWGGPQVKLYRNLGALPSGSVASLDCGAALPGGVVAAGVPASGASFTVPYTGGNGGAYSALSLASTGVSGLTATLDRGALQNGAGVLSFKIEGTASAAGTASFALTFGGSSCTVAYTVSDMGTVSSLECLPALHTGTLKEASRAVGVATVVPYTGGNGGWYGAQYLPSQGVTGLTAVLKAGQFATGPGQLSFSITGTPSKGGVASFPFSIGGKSCTFTRNVDYPSGNLASLGCSGARHEGTLAAGTVAASDVRTRIPYTGGNGGGIAVKAFASTGVTGLTANIQADTLAKGADTLVLLITGTPSAPGFANFSITVGGQVCIVSRAVGIPLAAASTLDCAAAVHSGALIADSPAQGVEFALPYTGGNGGGYSAQTIASSGVTGLTAFLQTGVLATGASTLTFAVSGTPSGAGTARFAVNVAGKSCTVERTVGAVAGSVAALQCSGAENTGVLTVGVGAVDVRSSVPYEGGNGGSYPGQRVPSVGVAGLTATLNAGNFANGTGSLVYTISGIPAKEGTALFVLEIGGKTCTISRPIVSGVASLNCNATTHQGSLTAGFAAVGASTVLPYTGGNGTPYKGLSVLSSGVEGLTATLEAGILANGAGSLSFAITGTPLRSGTASFAVEVSGKSCVFSRTVGTSIGSLDCFAATHTGVLMSGVPASGIQSSIPYTDGNGSSYKGFSVSSTGVRGLTATIPDGVFANGSGILEFTITGTPSSHGIAYFPINIGGRGCTLARNINPAIGSIASLICTGAEHSGALVVGTAAENVRFTISYNGGTGGGHTGQTVSATGVNGLTATLTPGVFANGAGTLTYVVTGTPSWSGTASFAVNIGGRTCTISRSVGASAGTIGGLDCSSATHSGTLTVGTQAASVQSVVPYTGGNGGSHPGQSVASTGVTGLKATVMAANFENGAGSLTYVISGVPSQAGTASFALNLGGRTCTLNREVASLPGTISALNCNGATHAGTLTIGSAAVGVSSTIPYSGGNGGPHFGQTVFSTGVSGLMATLAPGTLASGNGSLVYTITGTPQRSGTASFEINIGGRTCVLTRTVGSAIVSLNCQGATHNGVLTAGSEAIGISSVIPYTGGNGSTHYGQIASSYGVKGLTATLFFGSFANGSSNLTYVITGTPSEPGVANFALEIGGKGCVLSRQVIPSGTLSSLDCEGISHKGLLRAGIPASEVSSEVPYRGGNGGIYSSQTVSSTGVTGLTATLSSGRFALGDSSFVVQITGTPSTSGTASFLFTIGGQSCELTREVGSTAGSLTLINCTRYIANDSLRSGFYANNVEVLVPYFGGNGGVHPGQVVASTGVTGLTARLSAGSFVTGNGNLPYSISGIPASAGRATFILNVGGRGCTLSIPVLNASATIQSINCSAASNNGTLSQGAMASGVSSTIPYTGGNGGAYGAQIVASTGVPGLTATLFAGVLANGSGTIRYAINGTPTRSGSALFQINIGGQSCLLVRSVKTAIESIDCSNASHTGTLISGVPATNVVSAVPYTGGNGTQYAGQAVSSTGVTGLTATLYAGTLADGSDSLYYYITGVPSKAGVASFPISLGGKGCSLVRIVGNADNLEPDLENSSPQSVLPGLDKGAVGALKNPVLDFVVYPNPTKDLANIRVSFEGMETKGWLRVIDATGRQVGVINEVGTGHFTFDLGDQPKGMYYFVLFGPNGNVLSNRQIFVH